MRDTHTHGLNGKGGLNEKGNGSNGFTLICSSLYMLRVQEQNLVEMNKTQALHAGQAGNDGHLGLGRAQDGRAGPGWAGWLAPWPAAWPTRRVDASRRVAPFEMTSNVSVRNIGATTAMGRARTFSETYMLLYNTQQ